MCILGVDPANGGRIASKKLSTNQINLMKSYKKWGGGAGFVFLFLLVTTSSAFAQTWYIDNVHGSGSACTLVAPCKLGNAYGKSEVANTGHTFLFRVRWPGETVTITPPTAALTKQILFGAYVAGDASAVEGTVVFTGEFKIQGTGRVRFHEKVQIEFHDVTTSSRFPFGWTPAKSEERYAITGTLKSSRNDTWDIVFDRLVVSKSFTLQQREGKNTYTVNNGPLVVKSGATLTLGARLYVRFSRAKGAAAGQGRMIVDGAIEQKVEESGEKPGHIMMGGQNTARGTVDEARFIPYTDYTPAADGSVTDADCYRIMGSGMITVPLYTVAHGNVCIELEKVGSLLVGGSIQGGSDGARNITTDFIFKNNVVVEGDVRQYNDARVVFEKAATIRGDVIVSDGALESNGPESRNLGLAFFGAARTSSVRTGVRTGTSGKYMCDYLTRRTDDKQRALHIPGVQFEGAATIEGNLDIRAKTLRETTTHATQSSAACAPRVLFLAPVAKTSGPVGVPLVSRIIGNVTVEDTADFHDKGRIHLDSDLLKTGNTTRRTVHNVRVEGGIAAKGDVIGMAYPSTSSIDGMCTTKDTELIFGNHIVLPGPQKQVISGEGSAVMLAALVVHGDADVHQGPLTVKTLHVGPRAELMSTKDVKVTESLILQGELSGELDEASTIKRLTYGNRNTDVVKKAALHTMLDALAIHVGSGEIRLDEVVKTKNLGLCSGTLSLADAESTTDSTLHVTDQITVQNGMLEKDANDPGSISTDKNRYLLKYITPGKRTVTDALEWFAPQDVVVDHAKAEIMVNDDRSVSGKLEVSSGMLMMEDSLNAGSIVLGSATKMGTLQTEGEDVVVNGKVTVNGKSKLVTGGGDLHVLGTVTSGAYTHNTAQVSIAKDAMIHLGDGTLMLGPEDTKKRNNLRDLDGYNTGTDGSGANSRPDVKLTLTGSLTAGMIKVPKGSKETVIDASSDSKMLQTVVFDGTMTPGTNNHNGLLRILSATAAGKMLTIDSLSAMQGAVETHNKKVVITRDVALSSATIWPYVETTEFMGDLMISGTGGLNTEHNANDANRSVMIHGDFMQTKGMVSGQVAGVKLHPMTTKTVMGDLMVAADASRYEGKMASGNMPMLMVHGDFHFAKNGKLNVKVEFTGKEAQEVMTGDTTALHSITVNNAKGLLLQSHVMQQKMATLTLRQGKIHSMPMDSMFMWTVQNVQVEQELRGRSTAQEGSKCGDKNNEACKATILRGSRQSYVGGPVARHLLQGNAGAGFASGGYLFPVGMQKGDMSHYRPLILQLPSDLTDTTAATVSPVMVPDGAMPAWQNLTVPTAGGSLTLDVHADLFWKVDLGEESLPTNTNLRIAAAGLQNVADASGLRIVQWDCMWKNPKLAGRRPAQVEAGSFAVNGYISGVLHLTQEGIGLGSCAIFGIAANGIENPIDQADLSGGRANLQFIHNVPLPTSVDLHLGDIQIGSGIQFRHATAYRPVGAGSHELKIQEVGAPAEDAITSTLALAHNKNYVVIAHGSPNDTRLKVLETRMTSQVANQVDVLLVHGAADLGAARVEVLDPVDPMTVNMTLAGNLMLDDATRRYASLAPSQQIFRVKSMDDEVTQAYEMDLYGYANQTLVLNLSGMRNDLTILGVDKNGMIIPTVVVTGVEESAELPAEFALHGNYPNPFNPSTQIQFDLPENAQVQVQIVDMLGREVITLPAQEMEAGANRSIELHATSLASGTYLYRLIATGAEQRHVKTGRMTLVK